LLTPTRFGPYEITGPLGAGGMGQVYRARDTRLQRVVAVKVLHDAGGLDPVRQQRFAREAVAASALNHPNIVTVYDVGTEGETPYLVSELIEGGSLRSEMQRGRMPVRRAIDIAQQIADGLAAAHEAGIVHRDLKPENVMLTPDDRVKIVDFGLAKSDTHEDALGTAHTQTQTADGLIVGTVPYMSPEQARGDRADFRSDQFALGVMLFEMVTATHPFQRDSAVQTLSAIIADEPPDLAQASPPVPFALRLLLRRLLAKSPRERFAHTADLAAEIRTTRDLLTQVPSDVSVPVAPRRRPWPGGRALVVLAAIGGMAAGWALAPVESTVTFERFVPFSTDAGYQGVPAWSPDGRTIAYEAELDGVVQIFTRAVGAPMRTQITRSAFDCFSPFFSRDGRHIYFHSLARDADALWRISLAGGAPEVVIEGASRAHISPDESRAVFLRQEPLTTSFTLWSVALPDGTPEPFSASPFSGQLFSGGHLRFSPDGTKVLAWLGAQATASDVAGFWELPMPAGSPRSLLPALSAPGQVPTVFNWLPDSRHVVLTRSDGPTPGTHLWLVDTASGTQRPLTVTANNENAPAVAPDGRTLAFDSQATDFDLIEIPVDGSAPRSFLSSTRNEYDPAASPSGTQFAYVTDRTGNLQIWLQNEEGYLQQPIVTEREFDGARSLAVGALAFSPDGKRLAFQRADAASVADRQGGSRVWIIATTGGPPVPLGGSEDFQDAPTWSPDGESIAYLSVEQGGLRLARTRVGAAGEPTVLAKDIPPFVARPRWSPDGRWILCETADGLTVFAADGSSARPIGPPGWLAYAWDADSRRIFGLHPTDDLHHFMLVVIDAQSGAERVINPNLGTIPQALQPVRGFSRLQNGSFLTSLARVRSDIYLMEGLRLPPTLWDRLLRVFSPAT
jgi:Tol biopolymer transport system component